MICLGSLPKQKVCDFANGHGFIQHKPETINKVKNELIKLAAEEYDWFRRNKDKDISPWSVADRILQESDDSILYGAWCRIMNCDTNGREWGQSYFALNPDKGTQKEWAKGLA